MGQRGPKPVPDNVHAINGNPSKKKLNLAGSQDVPVEIPERPDGLTEIAIDKWDSVTKELFRLGLVARVDDIALELLCATYSDWTLAQQKLRELGVDGYVQMSPNKMECQGVWLQIKNKAFEQLKGMLAEFGMTPSARVRVNPSPQIGLFPEDESSPDGDTADTKPAGKKTAKRDPAGYFKE